jgi:hypothetical protein
MIITIVFFFQTYYSFEQELGPMHAQFYSLHQLVSVHMQRTSLQRHVGATT